MALGNTVIRVASNSIGDHFSKIFSLRAEWNPPSIQNNAEVEATIDVPGVKLGDVIIACGASIDLQFLVLTAQIDADDVVTLVLINTTGGVKDIGEGVFSVVVGRLAPFPNGTGL